MDADLLSDTFVELADTMVAGSDVTDFMRLLTDRSVVLLSASAAGVMLADPRGELRVAASSNEAAGLLELFQIQNDQGPCLDCYRTGRPVTAADLAGPGQQWPRFAAAATRSGFRTVEALPMRLRDQVIGALNLFRAEPGPLEAADVRIAQALAAVVIIEQAKGKLAERRGIDMDRAFTMLREYARNTNQRLTEVARDFVTGATAESPLPARRQPQR